MPITIKALASPRTITLAPSQLKPNPFSLAIYGDPATEISDLLPSIEEHGILVPLTVVPERGQKSFEVISGHRRLACAQALGLASIPCEVRHFPDGPVRQQSILEYNRQRRKTFSQLMREADALEELWGNEARLRSLGNLQQGPMLGGELFDVLESRNYDGRSELNDQKGYRNQDRVNHKPGRGRTDAAIARQLEMGSKDLYRQARAIWRLARTGDIRALSGLTQLDARTKTIHAVYKDLRRRDRFSSDFRPTPYDVWHFRQDRAFGIPHPGAIPPGIVAHALHYFSPPDGLVVDPMAGGGTTLDICHSMGRRCLAYDISPVRPDIRHHDIRRGFPDETASCDLIFCDPPYHTMLASRYSSDGIATAPLSEWIAFLHRLAQHAFVTLRAGGYLALLLAPQTEKDLPAGFGYLDHPFYGYIATLRAGFLPERRISCPMDGAYLPQHIRQARRDGRLLGQVRDLLIVRKPTQAREPNNAEILFMQEPLSCESAGCP